MELKKFISQFVEQFDNLDVSTINGETYFKEMDVWTSMAALMFLLLFSISREHLRQQLSKDCQTPLYLVEY